MIIGIAGMGVAISGAKIVGRVTSHKGCPGTISLTGLDQIVLRDGVLNKPYLREILKRFPFPDLVAEFWETVEGLRRHTAWTGFRWRWKQSKLDCVEPIRTNNVAAIIGSWVEVTRAFDIAGKDANIGVNLMWKIPFSFLASLYGALLAGTTFVMVGAGVAKNLPEIVAPLCCHLPAERELEVSLVDRAEELGYPTDYRIQFDPRQYGEGKRQAIELPTLLPIISSPLLSRAVLGPLIASNYPDDKKGCYAEDPEKSGGHHMRPRRGDHSAAIAKYGEEDNKGFRALFDTPACRQIPLWIGGDYCNPTGLREAEELGVKAVLGGTVFALCKESGMRTDYRRSALDQIMRGTFSVDIRADISPTGLPFSVANVPATLADSAIRRRMTRNCSVGLLAQLYQLPGGNGLLGMRCPAEPEDVFIGKGGTLSFSEQPVDLCRALSSTAGCIQVHGGIEDAGIVTLSSGPRNIGFIRDLITKFGEYTASQAIAELIVAQ